MDATRAVHQTLERDDLAYILPIGYRQSSSCGYCRRDGIGQSKKRHSYYARVNSLSPAYYESLIRRCWRRSGNLLYRPNQRDACCPHYTLRLDSNEFRPTKDQRQVVNRFNKFVTGDAYAKDAARLCPRSRSEARKRDTEFDLCERVHEAEETFIRQPLKPHHSLQVTLDEDHFTEEKYEVFRNYQQVVHHESEGEITRDGFRRFLCDSPLERTKIQLPDGTERQLGSYHQCYRLDGKLVAIGVLDLLPQAVSSVYFLYHESIHKWCPGKLGALREIALANEGGYRWWYSGYYIHTCPKMKYKMDFSPQWVLNPDDYQWIPLNRDIVARFDQRGYLHFPETDSPSLVPGPNEQEVDPTGSGQSGSAGHEDEDDGDDEDELPLFKSQMPGLPSMAELQSFPLDSIPVRTSQGYVYAGQLFRWQGESINDNKSAKARVAELVATVGIQLMHITCIDLA